MVSMDRPLRAYLRYLTDQRISYSLAGALRREPDHDGPLLRPAEPSPKRNREYGEPPIVEYHDADAGLSCLTFQGRQHALEDTSSLANSI